jgi:tetratricopeptide (TPR) repeat protein
MRPDFQQIAELFQLQMGDLTPELPAKTRKLTGRDANESAELGRVSLGAGDFEAAIRHFQRTIEQRGAVDPVDAIELAAAYEYGDQIPQAYRQYQVALRKQAELPDACLGLADLFKRSGRVHDAFNTLEELIAKEPANAYYRIKMAECLRDMGYPRRALLAAQTAVLCKPDESFYHYWVGDLMIQLHENEGALESLRAAIELSPGDDFLYLRVAVALWRLDKKPEAIKAIRMASDLDPDKHLYHGMLEVLLEEVGHTVEADLEGERADKMDQYDIELVRRTLEEMGLQAY